MRLGHTRPPRRDALWGERELKLFRQNEHGRMNLIVKKGAIRKESRFGGAAETAPFTLAKTVQTGEYVVRAEELNQASKI